MLGAKHGFAQSMDCTAQNMDPRIAQTIHGSRSVCAITPHELLLCYDEESSIVVGRTSFDDFIQQNFTEETKNGRGATLP